MASTRAELEERIKNTRQAKDNALLTWKQADAALADSDTAIAKSMSVASVIEVWYEKDPTRRKELEEKDPRRHKALEENHVKYLEADHHRRLHLQEARKLYRLELELKLLEAEDDWKKVSH